jgi:hypothetical protein
MKYIIFALLPLLFCCNANADDAEFFGIVNAARAKIGYLPMQPTSDGKHAAEIALINSFHNGGKVPYSSQDPNPWFLVMVDGPTNATDVARIWITGNYPLALIIFQDEAGFAKMGSRSVLAYRINSQKIQPYQRLPKPILVIPYPPRRVVAR